MFFLLFLLDDRRIRIGSLYLSLTNGSGFGSGRPKNICIHGSGFGSASATLIGTYLNALRGLYDTQYFFHKCLCLVWQNLEAGELQGGDTVRG
jgi:hypothetical protein